MEGVEEQPPLKRLKVSSSETSRKMDPPSEAGEGNEFIGPKGIIRKDEFVRIIAKALQSLGYKNTGERLEAESGILLHTRPVISFIEQVLAGNWDQSVATLREISALDEEMIRRASVMIVEQKFFELVDERRVIPALEALMSERVRLFISNERVKELTPCTALPEESHLVGGYGKDTPKQKLRSELLVKLQRLFTPSVLIAEDRLLGIVEHNMSFQRDTCSLENCGVEEMSLLADHHCCRYKLPKHTWQILREHEDQVWFVLFSHDGKYLASGSRNGMVIVWEVKADDGVVLKHQLKGHIRAISCISWSPDSKQLLSCGMKEVVRRWNVDSGECLYVYRKNNAGTVSCGWAPNGGSVYASANDSSISRWDLQGNLLQYKDQLRINAISDLAIMNDQSMVFTVSIENTQNRVILVDLATSLEPPRCIIAERQPIVSFSLSQDKMSVLVNIFDEGIHLWDVGNDPPRLICRYIGHRHQRFVVRSCFGGVNEGFVASGSEDSQVYIWHRKTGNLLEKLNGHTQVVNCVSWNPVKPHMLASASDDGTIRVWVSEKMDSGNVGGASSSNPK